MYKSILTRLLCAPHLSNKAQLYHILSAYHIPPYSIIANQSQSDCHRLLDIRKSKVTDWNYIRYLSAQQAPPAKPDPVKNTPAKNDTGPSVAKLTVYQRFKETYVVYGKLCIAIHVVTYCGWLSFFYLIVHSGLDVKWVLTTLYFPDWVTNLLGKPGVGELATAYILCKIFMVFRYGLTMYLTKYFGQILQRRGYLTPIKEENRIRNLAKEGTLLSKSKLKSHLEKKIKG